MKIGIGAVGLPPEADFRKAGTARYAFQIVEHMARLDPASEFHVYVGHAFPRPPEWDLPNIGLHPVDRYRTYWGLGGLVARRAGYDLWFAPVYEVHRLNLLPQVAMIHDIFPLTHPEWFAEPDLSLSRQAITRSCRSSRLLLANSEDTKTQVLERFSGNPDRIVVTPLGPGNVGPAVSPESVSTDQLRRLGLDDAPFLFALGTLEPRKNIPALIEAFALLRQDRPDLLLAIGGGKGWRDGAIFERVRELGLENAIRFLGYVADEDLPALFARCECFVMPSLAEGFGIPVLEAMHYGAPIACSDLGALQEVGGEVAVYFDPRSPEDIVRGIRERLSTDREPVVEKGFQRARRFTWENTANLTLAAMKTLLKK